MKDLKTQFEEMCRIVKEHKGPVKYFMTKKEWEKISSGITFITEEDVIFVKEYQMPDDYHFIVMGEEEAERILKQLEKTNE